MSTSSSSGFTLIEVIVSIGILVVLLQLVSASYSRFVGIQRSGIGQQEMQEDVRLFLQLFNREARTAFADTYVSDIQQPHRGIVFRNQEGLCVYYSYDVTNKVILRAEEKTPDPSHDCRDTLGGVYGAARQLTDDQNTSIDDLRFDAVPAQVADGGATLQSQGLVTVVMTVSSKAGPDEKMQLESSVTGRQFTPYVH